jgi:hypothetical protein
MYPLIGEPAFPELWNGCIGAWAPCLGPTGLTLRDWSGFRRHGTLTNMDTSSDWVRSRGQYAVDLDGSNDHISVPSSGLRFTGPQSVSLWVNWRSITVANRPHVFTLADSTGNFTTQMSAGINNFGAPVEGGSNFTVNAYSIDAGGLWGRAYTSATFSSRLNEWINFVFGHNGTTWQIYVNGVADCVVTHALGPRAMITADPLLLGASAGARYTDGLIDDVMMFNRMVTPSEARLLASRRGIAYELAPRRRFKSFTGGFKAYWAARKALIQMAGSN